MVKKFWFVIVFLGSLTVCQAQSVLMYYDGTPVREKKVSDIEGEEDLYPDWMIGRVKTKAGKIYTNVKLKYNLLEDQVYFQNADDVTMMFTTPIKELVFGDSASGITRVFRNGFPALARFTPESFFEILVDGENMLLKKTVKNVVEKREYNSSETKKYIQNDVQYFFYDGEKLLAVKKDKAAFVEGTKDKGSAVESYISASKLNLKKEEDLVKLVKYINTTNE